MKKFKIPETLSVEFIKYAHSIGNSISISDEDLCKLIAFHSAMVLYYRDRGDRTMKSESLRELEKFKTFRRNRMEENA